MYFSSELTSYHNINMAAHPLSRLPQHPQPSLLTHLQLTEQMPLGEVNITYQNDILLHH